MADERFNQFLNQNRMPGAGTGPVDVRGSIMKMREKKATTGAIPYMTNLINGVNRGMTQVIETPYNIINRAPQLVNLLPGDQGVGTIDEMAAQAEPGLIKDVTTNLFPSKDPLINAVAKHYPGMDGVGGIAESNPEYPITNRITEDVGTGVATMGAGALATGAKGLAGVLAKYLGQPLIKAPVAAVAGETVSAGGAALGRHAADEMDVQNPVGRFALEMAGATTPAGLMDGVSAGARHFVKDEVGEKTINAMDNLGMRPSIGLTGNQTAATLENAAAIIPGFGSVAKKVQTGQVDEFGNTLKSTASKVRPTGSFARADETMIGEQVHDIAREGLGRMKSGFGKREDALEAAIGPSTPIDVTNTRKAIEAMIPTVDPEMQGALRHELDLLDQMLVKNKTTSMQPKQSQIVGPDGRPMTVDAPVESVTATNTVPYNQFRSWRTNVGRRTDQPSIKGGQSKNLYKAITQDLDGAANTAGVGDDFRNLMAEQARAHDDELRMSEGGDIPAMENIATKQTESGKSFFLKSLANPDRVELLKRNATPEQWQQFAGDTLEHLGVAKNSKQGASGDLISPDTFLTNWNTMDPRVKNIMFDDNLGTRQTLDDLAIVAEAMRKRGNSSNFSNTAGVGMSAAALAPGAIPLAAGDLLTAGGGVALTYATIKSLMSETMARWAAGQGIPLGQKMTAKAVTGAAKAANTTEDKKQRKFTPRPVPVDDDGDHEFR